MNLRGLASSAAVALQAATLGLTIVVFWVNVDRRGEGDAVALEHRLTADEGAIKELGNRLDRLSDWLQRGGK